MNRDQYNNQYNNNYNNNHNYYDNSVNGYYTTSSNTQSGIINLDRNSVNPMGISNDNHPVDNSNNNNSARQNLINGINIGGSQGLICPTNFTNNHLANYNLDNRNMDVINNNFLYV